jgi:squalene-associated FAD-dependent desaturase
VAAIPRVIILGGGLAGLAAAACLAEARFEVEVLEKRPVLGGRASSFFPPGETERIDNCQHVLLGCCTNLLDFFRRTGTLDRFRFYNSFLFLGPRGASTMSASALPAPLHLLPSLLRFRDLGWRDRWAVARAMRAMLRLGEPAPDEVMLDWLQRQRQTSTAIENFWRVVLTSALNEDLERLSSRHAFKVFRDAFLRNRQGYRMGVPATSLSDLYSSNILSEKCSLRLGTSAAALEFSDGQVSRLRLRDGEEKTADYYISTVLPDAFSNLLPGAIGEEWPEIKDLGKLEWSPITGIHLWFDRPITELEHAAIVGRTIQWVFNRSAIGIREPGAKKSGEASPAPQYIQLVVSASRALIPLRRDEVLELSLRELGELFPRSREAKLLNAVVVKESKATLSLQPGLDPLRLGPETPFRNLYLAGDWTATGWPFTMEGAVRSGYRAAELVAEASGRPQHFLQPDLPVAPLVRLLGRF